ncbi:MAG: T9SS type A sorting domain-containing protein [Owenweeksia sp.]|nr:T9SS type A sorting domain-containing protein [Owenweeksia sp.]
MGTYSNRIDISDLADGTYVLKVSSAEATVVKRIVKK